MPLFVFDHIFFLLETKQHPRELHALWGLLFGECVNENMNMRARVGKRILIHVNWNIP